MSAISQPLKPIVQKSPSPKVLQTLIAYESVRQRLSNYFFKNQPLNIKNSQAIATYTNVYTLMNNQKQKLQQYNKYEQYEETYFNQYHNDLKAFCDKVKQIIKMSFNLSPEQFVAYTLQWVWNYTRFMHWTYRTFMVIQKYSLQVKKGTNLYYEGLQVLKNDLIQPIYDHLFNSIYQCLQLHKNKQLKSPSELNDIIRVIGTVGLRKYIHLKLQKQGEKFVFVSRYKQNQIKEQNQNPQDLYETQFFKRNFTNKLVGILKAKYTNVSNDLIKLSTPQYVDKALKYLNLQQVAADNFYPNKKVKQLVIRSLDEVLSHQKAEVLIKKPNTGLFSMLERSELNQAKKLLQLIRRSSNFKLFTKEYQRFIQVKGGEILDRVSAQDQKTAKKQTVTQMIEQFYKLYELMQRITCQVANNDTEIMSAQTYGFQLICNKGENKVCNFLAYYADNMLRKQQDSLNEMSDLTVKISKISKYLYSYDAFIKLYQKLFGLRMLFDNFKKKDLQTSIINVLKNQAGVTSLNKISCMVSDYMFSQNFKNQKQMKIKEEVGFKLEVMILTSGSWQIQDTKNGKSCVPQQLLPAVQTFQKIYSQQLPDRTLTWVFNYGRAIVLTHFADNVKHVLILNNYQLCILLYLQRISFKSAKIGQLLQELKVQDEISFNASIMMLLKIKVINKEGNPTKIQSKNQSIEYNYKFKYQSLKVRCFQLPRYVQKGGAQSGQLVLERSHLVDAAIVKVMKSKRIVQYQDLITEVQKMCKTFKADVGLIKKRIQNCQQREFLQRDPDDMTKLIYKP